MFSFLPLPFEGLPNTRDLGGFPAAGGKTVRKKRLLRSGQLISATKKDLKILEEEYRLAKIFDFRSPVERRTVPDPAIPGCRLYETDVLSPEATGVTGKTNGLDDLFCRMREDPDFAFHYFGPFYRELATAPLARKGYASFLRELIALPEDRAALWHCAAGKDRTGIGTAHLLFALGTPAEVIRADYLSHNENQKKELDRLVAENTNGDERLAKNFRDFYSVFPQFFDAAIDAMARFAGSPEAFPEKGLGLTKEEIEKLRENFLE